MQFTKSKTALSAAAVLSSAALAGTLATGAFATADAGGLARNQGQLNPLNNSGSVGNAVVSSRHRRIDVSLVGRGLAPRLPHAQHIHFGAKARHECPNVTDDSNGDFRLTTSEGAPAYGPVKVSLTTKGDFSPDSTLAVDRFPVANGNGVVRYDRQMRVTARVARAIRRGDAVVVIHGVDYNGNGNYDFSSAGASDLDSKLPAEATDPAACGVLR